MYFPDLSEYCYRFGSRKPLREVRTVGWLDSTHPFPIGACDKEILAKLKRLCVTTEVNQMRGFHLCSFCGHAKIYLYLSPREKYLLGAAELWIPGQRETIYAAPNLIVHYILAHNYLPPQEFLDAVSLANEKDVQNRIAEFEQRILTGGP